MRIKILPVLILVVLFSLSSFGSEEPVRKGTKRQREVIDIDKENVPPDSPNGALKKKPLTRSEILKTPQKRKKSECRSLDDSCIPSKEALDLIESKKIMFDRPDTHQREFPGAPAKPVTDRNEFFVHQSYGFYGNANALFLRRTQKGVGQYNKFTEFQRAEILLQNMILNDGKLVSDYHRSVMSGMVADALAKDGLVEKFKELRVPKDLMGDFKKPDDPGWAFFRLAYSRLVRNPEQKARIEKRLNIENFDFKLVLSWIKDSQSAGDVANVDHIIAKSQLGSNDLRNAAVCSSKLNGQKSDIYAENLVNLLSGRNDPYAHKSGKKNKLEAYKRMMERRASTRKSTRRDLFESKKASEVKSNPLRDFR